MLAQPWKSRLSQSFRPVCVKLDDDTVVSVGFLAWRHLSSSAVVVSCLAVVVQEAWTENTRHLSSVWFVPCLWNMDPVSSCGSERAHPCFLGSGMEGLLSGSAGRGPCRDTGSALWGCWGWCTGHAEASLGCVRVSNPEVEVINKISKGQKRECSPKISGDPNINNDSEYDNLCFKNGCLG